MHSSNDNITIKERKQLGQKSSKCEYLNFICICYIYKNIGLTFNHGKCILTRTNSNTVLPLIRCVCLCAFVCVLCLEDL